MAPAFFIPYPLFSTTSSSFTCSAYDNRPHRSRLALVTISYLAPISLRFPPHCSPSSTCDSSQLVKLTQTIMTNSLSTPPPPFGEYFTNKLLKRFPRLTATLHRSQIVDAANVYLFRFDKRLSKEFVEKFIDTIANALADALHVTVAEGNRIFRESARDLSRAYFSRGWEDVNRFIKSNTPALLDLQRRSTRCVALLDCIRNEAAAPEVDPSVLQSLIETKLPVIVFVYANYCSVCKQVRPIFEKVAAERPAHGLFVSFNGPQYPEFKTQFEFNTYPAMLRFDHTTLMPQCFPPNTQPTPEAIAAFADGDFAVPLSDIDTHNNSISNDSVALPEPSSLPSELENSHVAKDSPSPRRAPWVSLLKRFGIDELDVLVTERYQVVHRKISTAFECSDSGCKISPRQLPPADEVVACSPRDSDDVDKFPPMCVLLGGGMGAGKTTAIGLINSTPFWVAYGGAVVTVEADAFKLSDPLFQVLQGVTPMAASIVHNDSTAAAEELFVKAVNSRRDIVFDGTMSWFEYARQTIDMLRDPNHTYARGRGYVETPEGEVIEEYWVPVRKRKTPVIPYRVELVGVTADADTSVMRGIVRRITTGRDVSVPQQLNSHALFSRNFERYIKIVDAAYLFDTTLPDKEDAKLEYINQLVAIKPGLLFKTPDDVSSVEDKEGRQAFYIRFMDAYRRFLRKKTLNPKAYCADDLYPLQAVEQ